MAAVFIFGGTALQASPSAHARNVPAPSLTAPQAGTKAGQNQDAHLLDPEPVSEANVRLGQIMRQAIEQGDQSARMGQWDQAAQNYLRAVDIEPDRRDVLYKLVHCAAAVGDVPDEIAFYRKAIYATDPRSPDFWDSDRYEVRGGTDAEGRHHQIIRRGGWRENSVPRLMQYALLLLQTGQEEEALFVYHHALPLINYVDGHPKNGVNVRLFWPPKNQEEALQTKVYYVFLPDFGPGGAAYTPQRLRAMIDIAGGGPDRRASLQEAVRLYPDSAVAWFFLAQDLNESAEARAAFLRARELGDPSVRAISDFYLKNIEPYTVPAGP